MTEGVVELFRPVGPRELALIEQSGFRAFPPRLSWQPVFYPVLDEEYAHQIAREWKVQDSGCGFVTRFQVRQGFLDEYEAHRVGGTIHLEYRIPAEELGAFNRNLVGPIEVVAEYRA